jgi:hypothetical protein
MPGEKPVSLTVYEGRRSELSIGDISMELTVPCRKRGQGRKIGLAIRFPSDLIPIGVRQDDEALPVFEDEPTGEAESDAEQEFGMTLKVAQAIVQLFPDGSQNGALHRSLKEVL